MKILCESVKYFIIPIVSSDRYISCWLSFSFFICARVCISVSDCCLSQYSAQTFPFYFYARFSLSLFLKNTAMFQCAYGFFYYLSLRRAHFSLVYIHLAGFLLIHGISLDTGLIYLLQIKDGISSD